MPWPLTTSRLDDGQLAIGGLAAGLLVERFGTPLYVFDEATLRAGARYFRDVFAAVYPKVRVVYAGKAYLSPAIVAILWEEGLGLDVVSGGELYAGIVAGVAPAAMTFHGNNKSEQELREALDAGVGLIAVDNDREIDLLAGLTSGRTVCQPVLLRLNPGVEVDTHHKIRTGSLDSKFGFPIATGAARSAVERLLAMRNIELRGYHAHVGSQIFDAAVVAQTIEGLLSFAAKMRDRYGIVPQVVSPGGGFGVADDGSGRDAPVEAWARAAAEAMTDWCRHHDLPLPELIVEPGRALIGPAAVTLYRVGARKEIEGIRTYVSVDGGMADNLRPALYGARYSATVANRPESGIEETVTIAGKYCESGDVLIEEIKLPRLRPDDVLAVPMTGAYCLSMASNYNLSPRPAVVLVSDGRARLIRRRETYADLLATDVLPELTDQLSKEATPVG